MLAVPEYKNFSWTTIDHTASPVYCLINGYEIDFSLLSYGTPQKIDNTDVFKIVKSLITGEK